MNLNNRVKNRFEISEILKKLLLKVGKLDNIDLSTKADLISGVVPASQLPSYVDDVLEFPSQASFPVTGEASKIYISTNNNNIYRWSGSTYIQIGSSGSTVPNLQQVLNVGKYYNNTYSGYQTVIDFDTNQNAQYYFSILYNNLYGSTFLFSNNQIDLERYDNTNNLSSKLSLQNQRVILGQTNFGQYSGIRIVGDEGVIFERGASNDGTQVTLKSTNITGSRNIEFPNKSGTMALTSDILANAHSTTETVIGTWIDGKPIYRRVYTGTATGGVYTVTGLQSINLKSFITLKVLIKDSVTNNYSTSKEVTLSGNNQIMVIPFSVASSTPYFEVRIYNNNTSTPLTLVIAVIVEYTKTTD